MDKVLKVPVLTGLRRMFYIVTPNESSFKNVEDVPKYIDESVPFFFGLIVLEFAISFFKQDSRYRLNDTVSSVAAGMFSRLPLFLIRPIHIASYIWVFNNFCVYELPWNCSWTWILCFFAVDFGYYWFHRLAHEVNFMWAAHQVHHSSEYYNLTTALRQSVLQVYTSWVFYLPLALFIPPPVFMVHMELVILYQFWIHTQYVRTLGPLDYILNTPSHHSVHHGRNQYCIDRNYAGTLIIWDRMFGTFVPEEEEVVYGLTHPLGTFESLEVQFGFLKYMINRFYEIQGFGNKLCVIFFGPGWEPGKPRTGDINDIPKVKAPAERFDPKISLWLNIYIFLHFLLLAIGYETLMVKKAVFGQIYVLIFLLFMGFSLSCFGLLCDKKNLGVVLEVGRCLSFLLGDIALCSIGFYSTEYGPTELYALRVVYVLSIGIWLKQFSTVFKSPVKME